MKTKLFFLALLLACFSCSTNKPVSDAEKEKIKGEIKEVVNTIFKGCEEANFDMAMANWLDSPDLVFIYNGVTLGYKETVDAMGPLFTTLLNQKVTIVDEKYAFLDKSTVIYTTNCKFLENYKDGHAILSDPMAMQFTFKKINNEWKVIYGVESSVRQNVKNTETSKELNQVELFKQFTGIWKGEIGKDTTFIWEGKSRGNAIDANIKITSKGKPVTQGTAQIIYDKKSDKCIQTEIMDGADALIYSWWFTSKTISEVIPFQDISNPENASLKIIFEFKTPDTLVQTTIVEGKTVKTDTYSRIK